MTTCNVIVALFVYLFCIVCFGPVARAANDYHVTSSGNAGAGTLRDTLADPTLSGGDAVIIDNSVNPSLSSGFISITKPNLTIKGSGGFDIAAAISGLNWQSATITSDIYDLVSRAKTPGELTVISQNLAGGTGQIIRNTANGAGNGLGFEGIAFAGQNNSLFNSTVNNHYTGLVTLYATQSDFSSIMNTVKNCVFSDVSAITTSPGTYEIAGVGLTVFSHNSNGNANQSRLGGIENTIFSRMFGQSTIWYDGTAVSVHAAGSPAGLNNVSTLGTIRNSVFNDIGAEINMGTGTPGQQYMLGATVSVNSDYGSARIDSITDSLFNKISAYTPTNLFGGSVYVGFWKSASAGNRASIGMIKDTIFNDVAVKSKLSVLGGVVAVHSDSATSAASSSILEITEISGSVFNQVTVDSGRDKTGTLNTTGVRNIVGGAVGVGVLVSAAGTPTETAYNTAKIGLVDRSIFNEITLNSAQNILGGAIGVKTLTNNAFLDTLSNSSFTNLTLNATGTVYGGAVAAYNAATAAYNAKIGVITGSLFDGIGVTAATVYGGAIAAHNNTTAASARIDSITNTAFHGLTISGTTIRGGAVYSSGSIGTLSGINFDAINVNNGASGGAVTGSLVYAGGNIGQVEDITIDIRQLPKDKAAIYAGTSATLGGYLMVNGLSNIGPLNPNQRKASILPTITGTFAPYTVVQTGTGTISGNFNFLNGVSGAGTTAYDFIAEQANVTGNIVATKQYVIQGDYNLALAWTNGGDNAGTGNFTIASGSQVDGFNVDVSLADMTPTTAFVSGWDGKTLTKLGDGALTLSSLNTYTGGANVQGGRLDIGTVNAGASYASLSSDNLGSGKTSIAAAGSIYATTNSSYTFDNLLDGFGNLHIDNGATSSVFTFTGGVGGAFKGLASLTNNTFTLAGNNTVALTNATLKVGLGNLTRVGNFTALEPDQRIGNLIIDSGRVDFNASIGDAKANGIIITNDLTLNAGIVGISVSHFSKPDVNDINSTSLLEHDSEYTLTQLIQANGAVVGDANTVLDLYDIPTNKKVGGYDTKVDINQNGEVVAIGTYDVGLDTYDSYDPNPNGLYVKYLLTQIDLLTSGANALVLTPKANATDRNKTLYAKVIGSGDLVIAAGSVGDGKGLVRLNNADNSYTGKTTVASGTLEMLNNGVLGQTSDLIISNNAILDMQGYSQAVGALHSGGTGAQILNMGTLTIANGGIFAGSIHGVDGVLVQNGGTLALSGNNTYSGGTLLNGGALEAGSNTALGLGELTMAGGTTLGSIAPGISLANTINFGGDIALDAKENCSLALFGDITGANGMATKIGAGIVALDSPAFGIGSLHVRQGALIVGLGRYFTDLPNTPTTVEAGAVLSGTGAVGATTNYGTIAAINSIIPSMPAGNFTSGALDNYGTLRLAGSTIGNTFTVRGGMTAHPGSRMVINTFLGGDNSPTDRLILDGGRVDGVTTVDVRAAGGTGERAEQGIRIVERLNGALASPANFCVLVRPVSAGAYNYTLRRGGPDSGDDWYLTNVRDGVDDYRPDVSLLGGIGRIALDYAESVLDSFRRRMGGLSVVQGKSQKYLWSRMIGQTTRGGSGDGIYVNDIKFKNSIGAFQVGSDLWVYDDLNRTSFGTYLTAGQSYANIFHTDATGASVDAGTLRMTSQGIGLYFTHLNSTGGYLDIVTQGNYYRTEIGPVRGSNIAEPGISLSSSVESGWNFSVGDKGFSIEPQGQLTVNYLTHGGVILDDDIYHDSPTNVRFSPILCGTGRAGVRFAKQWKTGSDRTFGVWITPTMQHDFGSNTQTLYSINGPATTMQNMLPPLRGGFDFGFDGQLFANVHFTGNFGTYCAIGPRQQTTLVGNLGMLVAF